MAPGPMFGTDSPAAAWRPSPEYLERSRLRRFLTDVGCADLEELQARAEADPAWFWSAAVADLGIRFDPEPEAVLDVSRGPEWARWWVGAGFNYVAAAVDGPAAARPGETALVWEGEDGEVRRFTRGAAARPRWTGRRARWRRLGVGRYDRVGIFMPMIPETVIAVLAVGKLGAVYTPIFSGYGAPAVASRLADCEAKLLVIADGFWRRGKVVDMKSVADAALAEAPTRRALPGRSPVRDGVRGRAVARRAGRRVEPRPGVGRRRAGGIGRDRCQRPVHDHLHQRHDREAQGRGARPRRLPAQGCGGPGPLLRPAARRRPVLVHRHGLDDGSVGGGRRPRCSAPRWSSTRARPTIPGRIGCGTWSSAIGSPTWGSAPPRSGH